MNILWITNILFPKAAECIGLPGEMNSSGGWMTSAASELLRKEDINLIVATVSAHVTELRHFSEGKCSYYVLPLGRGNEFENKDYIPYWQFIAEIERPDIVHIHGTEYSHGLAYLEALGNKNVVISIQGLLSICSYYYRAGIPLGTILKNLTIHDLMIGGIIRSQLSFKRRGNYEIKMLKGVDHIIGRTLWDKSAVAFYNPNAEYHFCNETLNPVFYSSKWSYSQCKRHSIFLSQAPMPLKGLHILLEAIDIVKRVYPDVKLRIAGDDITRIKTISDVKYYTGYGRIIRDMIKRLRLEENVVFLGRLNAESMKSEYLSANVYVLSSSIENSPNSLGEAQLLGVPCIASYVGGVPDMIPCKDCGLLYRYDDFRVLALLIVDVFKNSPIFDNTVMRQVAASRHSPDANCLTLLGIYNTIIG